MMTDNKKFATQYTLKKNIAIFWHAIKIQGLTTSSTKPNLSAAFTKSDDTI